MSPPRRSPRQQRSRQTVAWILEAAAQLFAEHGYDRTTTNRVAERAGVSIGSLYQYFTDKDALLTALAEQHLDEATATVLDRLDHAARSGTPLPDLLRDLLTHLADTHTRAPVLHLLLSDPARQAPHLSARLGQAQQRIAATLADVLRRRGAGGADPQANALLAVQGIVAHLHGAPLSPPPDRSAQEVLEAAVEMWTTVLSAPGAAPPDTA